MPTLVSGIINFFIMGDFLLKNIRDFFNSLKMSLAMFAKGASYAINR